VRAGRESEGGSSGRDSSSDDEGGNKSKDLLHKLLEDEDGGELYKVTGHGVGGDCKRVLFYEINGGEGGEYSAVIEVRDWLQECEARNTERLLYFIRIFCRAVQHGTCTGTCTVQCLYLRCACIAACFIRVLHHAAHRYPAPHYALYRARFGGKTGNRIVPGVY
jgi:hypothetical protein